jgi:hypothetical protein
MLLFGTSYILLTPSQLPRYQVCVRVVMFSGCLQ